MQPFSFYDISQGLYTLPQHIITDCDDIEIVDEITV